MSSYSWMRLQSSIMSRKRSEKNVKKIEFIPQNFPQKRCFTDFSSNFCEFGVLKSNILHSVFWGKQRIGKAQKRQKEKTTIYSKFS